MVLISFHFLSGDPDCLPAAAPGRAHPPPHAAPDPPGISEDRERRGEVLLAAGFFYTEENPEPQTLFQAFKHVLRRITSPVCVLFKAVT